jgi:PAS domain-containing protein
MRWKQHIPAVPGSAIALSAMLLGFMVAIALAPYLVIPRSRVYGIDLSTALFVAISFCADAVIVLLAWKFLADRQSRTDRDLLNAFLEHIPDNVYFKDRESRFLRIGNAMAQYFGLDDPACAINKTDSDIFSSEHASQALTDEQKIIRTGEPIVGLEEKETLAGWQRELDAHHENAAHWAQRQDHRNHGNLSQHHRPKAGRSAHPVYGSA